MTEFWKVSTAGCPALPKALNCLVLLILIPILLASCSGKDETVTFSAEIEQVSENSILVETINFDNFDKASVDLRDAKFNFEPAAGQIVEVTILPEIRESYPVQVTAVELILKGEAERKVSDYFPISENTEYLYEGKGNEFAGFSLYADYTSEGSLQQMVSNGGTMLARVFVIADGKVTRVLSKGEVYYRENMLDQMDEEEVFLMEPLEKGTDWILKDGSQRAITGTNTSIKTPMGTFSCLEVITESKNGITIDYYAKEIGLVKTIFQSGGMEVSSTLKSVKENAARKQTVRLYYPDIEDGRIYYMEKELEYRTNDNTGRILEEAYKEGVGGTLGVVLPTNAAIKILALDEEENTVKLDLNAEFSSEMNAGAAYEALILQCIADTFGNYYNAADVMITVEGKPYESGHIKMEDGETVPVKLEGITEKN